MSQSKFSKCPGEEQKIGSGLGIGIWAIQPKDSQVHLKLSFIRTLIQFHFTTFVNQS